MKKTVLKSIFLSFVFLISTEVNAQIGGHAIKGIDNSGNRVQYKEDTRPYPVKLWDKILEWVYGKK